MISSGGLNKYLNKRSEKKTWKILKVFVKTIVQHKIPEEEEGLKIIQEPSFPSPWNLERNMKMLLIKTAWNPINPEFVEASSTSSLRFFPILPGLYTCRFLCSDWALLVVSFPSFNWKLPADICVRPAPSLGSFESSNDALSCSFCMK